MSEIFPAAQPLLEATTQVFILRESILAKTLGQSFLDKFNEQEEIRDATASAMPVDEQAMSWLIKNGEIRDVANDLGVSDATIDHVSESVYGNIFAAVLGMNELGDLSEEEAKIAKVENDIDDIIADSFGIYTLGEDSMAPVRLGLSRDIAVAAGQMCLHWEVAEDAALEFQLVSDGSSIRLDMSTVARTNKIAGFYWNVERKPLHLMEAPDLALSIIGAAPEYVSRLNGLVVPALHNKLGSIK